MPVKFRVRITRTAQEDIEDIWNFVAQDDPIKSEKFLLQLKD